MSAIVEVGMHRNYRMWLILCAQNFCWSNFMGCVCAQKLDPNENYFCIKVMGYYEGAFQFCIIQ